MRVLVACEFSGIVRDAFAAKGHDAWSCDMLPSERGGKHIQDDVIAVIASCYGPDPESWAGKPWKWDLMIAFPPCTHLAVSGARWFETKQVEQRKAIWFFHELASAPIPMIAIENPIGIMSTLYRKPDQVIQPWMFGHGETKATCLWLKNLPKLQSTHRKDDFFCEQEPTERYARVHREPPGPSRWKNRSRTYEGIAKAMAEQWTRNKFAELHP